VNERFFEFHNAVRQHRPEALFGAGEAGLEALSHTAEWEGGKTVLQPRLTTSVPWERADDYSVMRRLDPKVRGSWPNADIQDVDPRTLRASQRALTSAGVEHYFRNGEEQLFDKSRGPSNVHPIVYRSTDPSYPHDILLSGHHRAASALLHGQQLRALVVTGGLRDA